MTRIHPAVIERERREREERESESRRLPLYAPRPMPTRPVRERPDPAPERGVIEIDYTL